MTFIDGLYIRNTRELGARNFILSVVGETGIGKSYSAIRLAELYYENKLGIRFPIDNIVFTCSEFLKLVSVLPPCSIVIFDDAGLKYNASRWFDEVNQIMGYTLQSFRHRIINLFITIPVADWVDRIGRGLFHGQLELKALGQGILYWIERNPRIKDPYFHTHVAITFSHPDPKFCKLYERKKKAFLDLEYKNYYYIAKEREKVKLPDEDLIEIILDNPDQFMLDNRFNRDLIKMNLNISYRKAGYIYTTLKKIYEIKK
jgi:hypothetical protein